MRVSILRCVCTIHLQDTVDFTNLRTGVSVSKLLSSSTSCSSHPVAIVMDGDSNPVPPCVDPESTVEVSEGKKEEHSSQGKVLVIWDFDWSMVNENTGCEGLARMPFAFRV